MKKLITRCVIAALLASAVLIPHQGADASIAAEAIELTGGPTSALDATPVQIDADLYIPTKTPAPAIVLAHGFGGNKHSLAAEAQHFVNAGFVVLAYTARGFGESGGQISMNSPQFEVADASALITYLGEQTLVKKENASDPIVGVAGGSYGGALALLLAGYDKRIDAVASDITWNDLETSLFGQNMLNTDSPGVFKQFWTSAFFSSGLASPQGRAELCGRFSPQWCAAYTAAATTGRSTEELRVLMRQSSPASITSRITVPTLLGGGQADSLFPLQQVNANAQQIRSANPSTPVKVVWHGQGHDGGVNEGDRLRSLTLAWFRNWLANGPTVPLDFEASIVESSVLDDRDSASIKVLTRPDYPGLLGTNERKVSLSGPTQRILAPAGGVPATVSSLPGIGSLGSVLSLLDVQVAPNQNAAFISEPLEQSTRIIGASRVSLTVSSDTRRESTLFIGLRIQSSADALILPNGLIAPVKVELDTEPRRIDVELPPIVADVAAGSRFIISVSTTDQAYRLPMEPALYTVALAESSVVLPQVEMTTLKQGFPVWGWPIIALGIIVIVLVALWLLRPRIRRNQNRFDLTDSPLVIEGLVKQFGSGVRAVAGVDFVVPRGVVLGLLGPNGAGKTTTMRMAMGLIRPTEGEVFVFGRRVTPGAPVLSRIGTFIEGPGFLPHLSGRQNLELFWRASGRSGDSHFNEVLEIAGLGPSIDRKVRTYSQGMKQRLGIAQAMLGMPDVLILDEPTNGLDPPQIREMRQVLRAYATDGRTVILSSHLLGEVEQTCSHVVVMHRGKVVASGAVPELLAGRSGQQLEDVFMDLVGSDHLVNAGPLAEENR